MREFGLAAVLKFKDMATGAMAKAKSRAEALGKSFEKISGGVGQMSKGLGELTAMTAPVAAGFGLALHTGAKFEQEIANLRAVTLDTANKTTPALEQLALTMGSTTTFSATETAKAMTDLARAGFSTKQVMEAIPGVLNAAAAEGIDLSTAAEMVVSNVNAFNLTAAEGAKVAGTMALASARFSTSMVDLQEGLKYAAPAVKGINGSLADTTAILGAMSNIGIKAAMGGPAIQQMMARLSSGQKAVTDAFGGRGAFNDTLQKAGFFQGDLIGTTKAIIKVINAEKDPLKRLEKATAIFGVRARGVGVALQMDAEKAKDFDDALNALRNETGDTAKQMAAIQLNTFSGQMTLLKAATEGLSIQFFKLVSSDTGGLVKGLADNMGRMAMAMRVVSGERFTDPKDIEAVKALPIIFLQIATGVKEGFQAAKQTLSDIAQKLGFDIGKDGAEGIAKIVTEVIILTTALAPLAVGVLGVGKALSAVGSIGVGAVKTVGGIAGMVGNLLGGKGGAVGALGKAGSALGNATATPVRVVNFSDMPGGGGGGIPGLPEGAGGGGGMLAGLRAMINGSRVGTMINGVKGLGGQAALVGAAGLAGYGVGTAIDQTFGISDKIGDLAHGAADDKWIENFEKMRRLKKASIVTSPSDIMTTSARSEMLRQTNGVLMDQYKAPQAAGRGDSQGKIVEKLEISVPLKIDGKEIARGQAEIHIQDMDRSGQKMAPGGRMNSLTRGTMPQRR